MHTIPRKAAFAPPRRLATARLLLGLVLLAALPSCAASNVVAVDSREVKSREDQAPWKPAKVDDLPGSYRSGSIEGSAAASMLKLFYYFDADGSYSGAALVASRPPRFQILNGRWSLSKGKLLLGEDSEPATLEVSEDMLRLSTSEGKVVLYRDEIR